MPGSEFEDAYEDEQRIRGVMFNTLIGEFNLRQPVQVKTSTAVADAVAAMNANRIGCLLVTDNGKTVGIFTERDVLTRVIYKDESRMLTVGDVMTPNPESLSVGDTIAYALNKMSVGGYRHIPINDETGMPIGVLSVRDIVDFLVELFPESVLNLPPRPDLGIPQSVDGG
jgi:signal-transduction protein with cAMP-binding, CBS, and nucleotidyltransferase domain